MITLQAKIKITNKSSVTIKRLGNLIQNTVDKVDHKDMIQLLEKVRENPGIVKQALKALKFF